MTADTAPAWDGVPENPERDGWHWLHHPEDLRPIATPWVAEISAWSSGAAHSPQGVVDRGFHYLGPCLTPSEVTAREAAAWAAGAAAMQEAAEVSADCGCDVRAIVLERLASHGLREAGRCCGQHYDACCALSAAAIRALPLPPMPGTTQEGAGDE